jgi:hypothetical protein
MKKPALVLLFSFAAALAACGGGGGSTPPTGGGTPTPLVSATPTPTPTPASTNSGAPVPTPMAGTAASLAGPNLAPNGGYLPTDVANALDFPVQHGWDGTGQTIAIVIDSDVPRSDIAAYLAANKLPSSTSRITTIAVSPLPAPTVVPTNGAQDEATLDVETVAGLAPGANIRIYEMADLSDTSITNAYSKIISDGVAFLVNSSFGGCEGPPYTPFPEDPVIASGASKGIAWFASAGDQGNVCGQTTKGADEVGASWPASNPNVIGVGGNESDYTQPGGSLTSPKVWNDKTCGSQCAGGGGVSQLYLPAPAFQTPVLSGACTSPPSGAPCTASARNTPDFSLPAEFVSIYENGTWAALNGTSWSSPEAAALFSELYQYCGASGGGISGVTTIPGIPYYVFEQNPNAFIDINQGTDEYSTDTPFYAAVAGYDDAGGLGVPKGGGFIQIACPNRAPASGLTRTRMSMASVAMEFPQHSTAYTVDVTPRVNDISDLGVRDGNAPTGVQIVVQPDAAASNEAAVVSALQSGGFTITQTFSDHLVVNAVAPSSTVEQFFRTRMHDVSQGRYGVRYLPTTQIVVPASIAPYTARVTLDNVIRYHHLSERVPPFMPALP